jgi:hypothetical protein
MRLLKVSAALPAGLFLLACGPIVVAGCGDERADADMIVVRGNPELRDLYSIPREVAGYVPYFLTTS